MSAYRARRACVRAWLLALASGFAAAAMAGGLEAVRVLLCVVLAGVALFAGLAGFAWYVECRADGAAEERRGER